MSVLKRSIVALIVILVLGLASVAVREATDNPQQSPHSEEAQKAQDAKEPKESLWRPGTWEPITFFTAVLALLTLGLVFVAIIQIVFLSRADRVSSQSADAALRAADAAFLQAEIMLATQRAMLYVRRIHAYKLIDDSSSNGYIAFAPEIENVGTRPTTKCVAVTHHMISDKPISVESFDFVSTQAGVSVPGKQSIKGPFRRHFGPKSIINGPRTVIFMPDLILAHVDQRFIYIWGWMDYGDGFEKTPRRRTEFAYEIVVRDNPMNGNEDAFWFPMLDEHNGADDDCYRHPTSYEDGMGGRLGQRRTK